MNFSFDKKQKHEELSRRRTPLEALVTVAVVATAAGCTSLPNQPVAPNATPTVETPKALNEQNTATNDPAAAISTHPVTASNFAIPSSLNVNIPSSVDPHKFSKAAITTGVTTAAIGGAVVYKSLTEEQKKEAQLAALSGTKKALQKWQTLSPEERESLKGRAGGLAGKAKSFWHRLPSQ
jgi:hypothetical protein